MRGGRPGEHWWPTDLFSLGSGYSFALRRSAGLAVGGFDPSFGAGARFGAAEDTLMLYRLLVSGLSIVCSDDVEIIHPEWRDAWRGGIATVQSTLRSGALVFLTRSASVRAYAARRLSLQRALISESITQGKWTEAFSRASYLVGYIHPLDKIRLLIGGLKDHPMSFQALSEEVMQNRKIPCSDFRCHVDKAPGSSASDDKLRQAEHLCDRSSTPPRTVAREQCQQ